MFTKNVFFSCRYPDKDGNQQFQSKAKANLKPWKLRSISSKEKRKANSSGRFGPFNKNLFNSCNRFISFT